MTERDLEPEQPEDEGIEPETPPAMQIEAARVLANEARDRLHEEGFTDEQIRRWAETFVAEAGTGAVLADVFAWSDVQQD